MRPADLSSLIAVRRELVDSSCIFDAVGGCRAALAVDGIVGAGEVLRPIFLATNSSAWATSPCSSVCSQRWMYPSAMDLSPSARRLWARPAVFRNARRPCKVVSVCVNDPSSSRR